MNMLTIKTRKGPIVSTLVLLGLGAYAQGAAAGCGTMQAYQTLNVPSNFNGATLQSGSYWNTPAFSADTCKHFVVDVKLNSNSNIENNWAEPVVFGAGPQNANGFGGPNVVQSSCPHYTLHEMFYQRLARAGAFTYQDYASYKGVWIPEGLFAAHCEWTVTKAPSIDWQSQLATSGNWDTYRVAARMTYESPLTGRVSYTAVKVNVSDLPEIPD